VGENTVTLKLTGAGSNDGIMYDCIKLEAGSAVTGIDDVTAHSAASGQPAKYLRDGRLVIERGGRSYGADGRAIR
jgi:hypothetical protein